MKNTLGDLNKVLFAQLEKLSNDKLSTDNLDLEIRRTHAISGLAKNIINNGDLVLRAKAQFVDRMDAADELPKMLMGDE